MACALFFCTILRKRLLGHLKFYTGLMEFK